MKTLFTALTGLVAVLFLAAIFVAVGPSFLRDEAALLTTAAPEAPEGTFVEIERAELFVPIERGFTYTAPPVFGAIEHQTLNGLRPMTWLSFARTASDEANPLVLLFPGAGRSAMSMIHMWKDVAEEEGLVLVAVPGLRNGDAAQDPRAAQLHDILATVYETYPIDREQVFLFGHSAGGIYAQVVANRVSGPWRAVAVHAGHVVPSWLHPIENAPPVRHYLGSSDATFSPANSRIAGAASARAGHDHELIIIPRHNHWFYEIGPTIARDAWDWFDSLDAAPPTG